MAYSSSGDGMGMVKIAVYLHEGENKTVKVWRFQGDVLTRYTCESLEHEILELFLHVKRKGLRLCMHYYDDLTGKVFIDSDADMQNILKSFTEEWSSQDPRKSFIALHVEDCIDPDKPSHTLKRTVAEADCCRTTEQPAKKVFK